MINKCKNFIKDNNFSIVVKIVIIIATIEFLLMQTFAFFNGHLSPYDESIVDTFFLSLFSAPLIYIFVIKPFINKEALSRKKADEISEMYSVNVIASNSDLEGMITYASKALCTISGYTEEELMGQPHSIFRHPDTPSSIFEDMWKTIQKGISWHGTLKNRTKDGDAYWVKVSIFPNFDNEHNLIGYRSVRHDITEIIKARQEMDKQVEILDKLTLNIPGVIYQYKVDAQGQACFPYASNNIYDIYEVNPNDVLTNAQAVFDVLHPDDVDMIIESIQESAHTLNDWNIQYRVNLPNQGLKWLEGFAKPEKLNDGSTLWHGYISDITERKKDEEKLLNQYKLTDSIIDNVPTRIFWKDKSGQYLGANQAFLWDAKLTSRDEIIGKDDFDMPWGKTEAKLYREDDLHIMNTNVPVINFEEKQTDSQGNIATLLASKIPLKDIDGNLVGILGTYVDITEQRKMENQLIEQKDRLQYQAHHDSLTNLPNRLLLQHSLEQSMKEAKRDKMKLALLFIDLDRFKEINDSLGHDVGDKVLKNISTRLRGIVREQDTVSRLGGDEFTIILNELHQVQDASLIAEKILKILSKPIEYENATLYVTCSIGISIYPNDGLDASSLLKFADSAMYKAKEEGRNNYQYYSSEMTELAFQRVVMETALRAGIERKEFLVYYQPQVHGETDTIIGMEALVRWQHPTMGLVSPDKFIPLAESTGLIVELDRYVMKTAMKQISQWYEQGFNPGVLSMNLAVKQLKQDDFIEVLQSIIEETNCKAEWIELEVTEGQVMKNPEEAIKILQSISNLGIELAIDDFGTGYSSLAYLKRLPIDKLKIDQAFIRDLPDNEEDIEISKAVIALANSLHLKIVAEGVETKEQRDFLVESGCENIQGYFYSKPVPADAFKNILRNGIKV